jgi:hypothetical protein
VLPSALTDVEPAVNVERLALAAPAVKATEAVCVTVTESVVSVAVKTVDCAFMDFTVNVATPLELVVALAGEIVTPELGEAERLTVLFWARFKLPS